MESLPGQGATFVFELPLGAPLESDAPPEPAIVLEQASLFDPHEAGADGAAGPTPAGVGDPAGSGVG